MGWEPKHAALKKMQDGVIDFFFLFKTISYLRQSQLSKITSVFSYRMEVMKKQIKQKSELETKALRIVECLLEDDVTEEFLIESVSFREGCLKVRGDFLKKPDIIALIRLYNTVVPSSNEHKISKSSIFKRQILLLFHLKHYSRPKVDFFIQKPTINMNRALSNIPRFLKKTFFLHTLHTLIVN